LVASQQGQPRHEIVEISVDKSAAALEEGQKHAHDRAYITV
jgi:hypothetical protein